MPLSSCTPWRNPQLKTFCLSTIRRLASLQLFRASKAYQTFFQEPGEVEDTPKGTSFEADEQKPILNKVHIRGVDTLNPADIKAYVQEHYAASSFDRIEWIDDASANLLFKSDFTAAEALIALCAVEIADVSQLPPLELLPAKPYSQKPDAVLLVRFAAMGDRKQSGAAARSRFYLLHPEYDPEERRRRGDSDRGKYRDRDDDRYRRSGRRRVDRWEDEAPETFDVSLYDDDEAALAKRSSPQRLRRRSMSRSPSIDSGLDRYARQNRDKELFPDHRPRERNELSSRNRSASPARSRDGDQAMETSREHGAASRNRDRARSIKDRLERDNSSKELFPSKVSTGPATAQMDRVDLTETITKRLSGMSVSFFGNGHEARVRWKHSKW